MRYPWADTHAALMALRENGESDPYDGIMIMLASPVDGGPTLPTIAWQAQLLSKKQKTLPHRHNSTTFYFAFEGEGAVVIESERLEYRQGRYLRRAGMDLAPSREYQRRRHDSLFHRRLAGHEEARLLHEGRSQRILNVRQFQFAPPIL